jgi:hypothetical protein
MPLLTRQICLCQDAPRKAENEDDDDEEEVTAGIANVSVAEGGNPAPFSFNPAPKGQSPFAAAPGGGAAPMFSFPTAPGATGGAAAAPNFSFNFAAQQGAAPGGGGDGDEEDEEDEEDPVEEFIKSLPEPVQKCVSALDSLDEEVCDLEAQFRKELRDLERKVLSCPSYLLLASAIVPARTVSMRFEVMCS